MRTIIGGESVKVEDASRLASYLRTHPEAFDEEPDTIAKRFDMPVEFVESVLSSLGKPKSAQTFAPAFAGAKSFLYLCRLMFRRLTHDPLLFIGATTAVGIGIFLFIDSFFGSHAAWLTSNGGTLMIDFQANNQSFFSVAVATMILQQACYFRHGQIRFALLGGIIAWVVSAMTVIVIGYFRLHGTEGAPVVVPLLLLAYVMLILCAGYAVVSVVTSVLGGAYWVRKHEVAKEKRTRQELIEHLFELQERIAHPEVEASPGEESFWRRLAHRWRPWFLAVSIVAGLVFSVLRVSTISAFAYALGEGAYSTPLYWLTAFAMAFVQVFAMSLVAFIGGRVDRAIVAAVVFYYATLPAALLPIEPFGMHTLRNAFESTNLVATLFICTVVGSLAALGAKIESRAAYQRKLHANDRSALLAEIVRTEWQLELQTVNVCVLVVDVVRSSRMKANANPLEVEYSFREYQGYVARICHLFEGIVHSTAGDGAVVAFYNAQNAFESARRIQLNMNEFNTTRNRLATAFRVRIGLHMGSVAGDIGDVQFSEVIDIAAHFESAAPPGGIALSSTIAEQIPGIRLQPMEQMVTGHVGYFHIPIEEQE